MLVHQVEQVFDEGGILLLFGEQAQLRPHALQPGRFKLPAKAMKRLFGELDGLIFLLMQQRQQALGEPGQVPYRDVWLIAVGISTLTVDGTEYGRGVVRVHKGTGPVVDRLAAKGHVVGVHHAVDEPDQLPLGDQRGLALSRLP
ncbi:hypothetical protein D3C74_357750 [compost metagenome]